METVGGAIGAAATAVGVFLLWRSWARRREPHAVQLIAAWALLFAALTAWGIAGGDRGAAVGVAAIVVAACAALTLSAGAAYGARRPAPARAATSNASAAERRASFSLYARSGAVFLLAGPLAGGATLLLTLFFFRLMKAFGMGEADRIAAALLVAPALWAGLAVYVVMDESLRRRSAVVAGAAAFGAACLALLA
ncbi:hypothetical protein [Amphiplicatus metriothermophilus]|uniref:Uncharacterized protein n=1 Tax=Amphiplicatus metriothermophilus TaxID=1519374 RepID=A0A239PWJ7_9PROT|nr:hypothetical protein [Amphiplicatus metriothermophilus]MBB5519000.1 peptidoglycan/LPS O-acetylase OafA/YrhL [Amphiplicatus metriothermophilus]SNT74625.1 hypothetical protein SAMN06297382_2278 [Amphiplicatus metriothermophilus]